MRPTLPEPVLERFQPLRSGLINLYKYENQEFWFERGRLLLRGNNGSGKSRVLALQLPFLFDGEISPHRVEPDGDPAKALAWNLLMNQYDDRLGYTWIEFGRQPRSGPAKFVTLGCGIRAIKSVDGLPNRWYFVTEQRVGLDFCLVTENRQPLSRDQLANVIGEGAVYRTPQDYRREVDSQLFGLKARYEGLIELLIRLRAPQLARKLDEQRLSSALSDALPPLSDILIGDVAESFSNLDSLRADLDEHRQMHGEVGDFLQDYCRYLQVAARRRAEAVRSQHSRYEDTNREIAEKTRYKEIAAGRISEAETAKRVSELAEHDAYSQIEALRDSPFQRDAVALENAHKHAELCRIRLTQAVEDVTARDQRLTGATQERLLTERERAAIDNHLIGEVATTLQELIRDAETKVADMNEEITRCSTSTGLTMRLRWEPRTEEVPEGLPEARQLLLADSELWSPEERKQLGQFLHGLIKDARAANPLGVWNDHLRQALDYRTWHTFAVERRQNDKWEKLTKRRYGTGSGGEKALMLTVPQMAAAAAHYRSGASYAPRLILLDEVFVGIDSKVRAKCMGLLEAFDLDFIMTSEREWGAYSTISGLAIYQLTTRPGIDAIATTRWVWNGQQRIQADPMPFEYAGNANGRKGFVGQP